MLVEQVYHNLWTFEIFLLRHCNQPFKIKSVYFGMIWWTWGLNGMPEKNYILSLHAKDSFRQGPKHLWSNIIKLSTVQSFLWQRMIFTCTHQRCLILPRDFISTFYVLTFWKLQKQKPRKFLNCWLQKREYSKGKDHSVIAMVCIHFPQTSVMGHCQKQVTLLQTFSLTQDDSFYILINSINPTTPTQLL